VKLDTDHLDAHGWARIPRLLRRTDARSLVRMYDDDARFRKRIEMEKHGYGRGEYKYFAYPLPDLVAELRSSLYEGLVDTANRWNEAMRIDVRYPPTHSEFLERCHNAGQTRPTPLVLRYEEGGFNALHQDLYGEHVFPLQVAILLAEPGNDFTGGEFELVEQRPRMQSRAEVIPFEMGDAIIWAVRHRPMRGTRGTYRLNMRHGVSTLRSGHCHTLGIIFHDAK